MNRLDRVEGGNFGDCEPVGEGVSELRIDDGPGYRIYFGEDGDFVILLLGDLKAQRKLRRRTSNGRKNFGRTTVPKRTQSYQSWRLSKLADPFNAASYLNAAINDSPEMFLKALRNVAQARQIAKVARDAGVTRESLYRATSEIGNPTLDTFVSILSALRLKFTIEADASVSPAACAAHAHQATSGHYGGAISNLFPQTATQQQSFYRAEQLVSPTVAATIGIDTPPPYMIRSIKQREEYAN